MSQFMCTNDDESLREVELKTMRAIQKKMYDIPPSKQTPEFFEILKSVNKYLHKYCKHNVVEDLIDIDPDRSKYIRYCTICGNNL
jgi:Ni,Fe-hydrogenase III large subunit